MTNSIGWYKTMSHNYYGNNFLHTNISKQNSLVFQSLTPDPIKFYRIIIFWKGSSGSWNHDCFFAKVTSGTHYFVFIHIIMTRAKTFFCSLSVSRMSVSGEESNSRTVLKYHTSKYVRLTHPGITCVRYRFVGLK